MLGPISDLAPDWVWVILALVLLDYVVIGFITRFRKPPNVNSDPPQIKRPRIMPPPPPWNRRK